MQSVSSLTVTGTSVSEVWRVNRLMLHTVSLILYQLILKLLQQLMKEAEGIKTFIMRFTLTEKKKKQRLLKQ